MLELFHSLIHFSHQEHIPKAVNVHVLTILNNHNFIFCSFKVKLLLNTIELFTLTDVSFPRIEIDVVTFNC